MNGKRQQLPKLNIRSKNDLAKHLSSSRFSKEKALALIDDVFEHHYTYWKDSKESKPLEQKFVRTCVGTPLHLLLKLIDRKILRPNDHLIPGFIFGGLSGKSHIDAAGSLLGKQKGRILLKIDVHHFFEQISDKQVVHFFIKCGCSERIAKLLASFCCVSVGEKNNSSQKTLARGFSTSPRLAVWTNLSTFQRIKWIASKALKGHDPCIAIYVDDIGISASRIQEDRMEVVKEKVITLLEKKGLPISEGKTRIRSFSDRVEHLGLVLGRNNLTIGSKTRSKFSIVLRKIKKASGQERTSFLKKKKAYSRYKKQLALKPS